jgi:hypothetical protein
LDLAPSKLPGLNAMCACANPLIYKGLRLSAVMPTKRGKSLARRNHKARSVAGSAP